MDGFPVTINAPRPQSSWLKWFLHLFVSFDNITLLGLGADTAYESGTVLGQVTLGAQTVAAAVAGGANAGNGAITLLTGDAGVMAGDYYIVVLGAASATAAFMVVKPDGSIDGFGKVGTAYNGSINFTATDGAAHFAGGDEFKVSVSYAAGSGKYVLLDPAATDGSQNFAAILGERVFIPTGVDVDAQGVSREAVVVSDALIWKAGTTDNQKAAVLAQALSARIYTKTMV